MCSSLYDSSILKFRLRHSAQASGTTGDRDAKKLRGQFGDQDWHLGADRCMFMHECVLSKLLNCLISVCSQEFENRQVRVPSAPNF